MYYCVLYNPVRIKGSRWAAVFVVTLKAGSYVTVSEST